MYYRDAAGQFYKICLYFFKCLGALLVYDVSNRESLQWGIEMD